MKTSDADGYPKTEPWWEGGPTYDELYRRAVTSDGKGTVEYNEKELLRLLARAVRREARQDTLGRRVEFSDALRRYLHLAECCLGEADL